MKIIGSGLHLHTDDTAGAVAKLGVDCILLQIYFLYSIHRRCVAGLLRGHRRSAVQYDVILAIRVAADIELVCGPVMERALLIG